MGTRASFRPKNTLDSITHGDTISPYFPDHRPIPHTLDSLMKPLSPWFCRFALFLSLLATALLPQANGANDFVTTGGRVVSADTATYTLLPNGKVLVAGGYMTVGNNALQTNLAELYDPVTGMWSQTASMTSTRYGAAAILLSNGKVLVTGGVGGLTGDFQSSAELYDPVTRIWNTTGGMIKGRYLHTLNLLPNGKVLASGGYSNNGGALAQAELYDPATGVWSSTGEMINARQQFKATSLANGNVLVTGGGNNSGSVVSAELYDHVTGKWSSTNSMVNPRTDNTATLLASGEVLITGGQNISGTMLSSAELYNPVTGLWRSTGDMLESFPGRAATFLRNGTVLLTGGRDPNIQRGSNHAELYNPLTGLWTKASEMNHGRDSHSSVQLANGRVLLFGGIFQQPLTANSAEIYRSDSSWGDYYYFDSNGGSTITGYGGQGGVLTIPSTIEGFQVTAIADNAFYGCTNLTSVTIPASVTSIGNQAFSGCSGLTSVNLPESFLTDIEYIGLTGQVAANTLIQGVADNLGGNSAFITDFTNAVLSQSGNYGLSTKTDLSSAVAPLASKTELAAAVASLASKAELEPLATKMELSTGLAPLATKTELGNSIAPLATKEELTSTVSAATASLATKTELSTGLAPLASKTELNSALAPLATKEELTSTVLDATAPLATKTELASQIDALAQNPEFVAALAKNPAFLTALANQIIAGPNQYGIAIKQNQTLLFPVIPTQTYRLFNKTLTLAATSSAMLTPITYTSSNVAVATISGKIVTLKGKGSTTITASQVGNGHYDQASAKQVLKVN